MCGSRDELERVAVAGDDDDVDAFVGRAYCERRDHVVGLDARNLQLHDLDGLQHFVDQRQLRREEIGRLLAARLVVGVELVPERRPARRVERDRDVVGLLVGHHLREHRREAVHRVRHGPGLRREVGGQREEGAVRE